MKEELTKFETISLKLLVATLAILAPVQTTMIAVGALIVLDMITGIWAALKLKQAVTSSRMRDTVSKMIIYQIAIISGFILEKYILADSFPVSRLVAGVIGVTELTSLLENCNNITGTNIFDALIKKLGSKNNPN